MEVSGDYSNHLGLKLEKFFIRHNTATLHVEGTLLGPAPNLHFAVLHFPANLVAPLYQAARGEDSQKFPKEPQSPPPLVPPISPPNPPPSPPFLRGIIFLEGDYRGTWTQPQCEVTVQLLDGSIGGVSMARAEVAASLASSSRLAFQAYLKPSEVTGEVRVQGSVPFNLGGESQPLNSTQNPPHPLPQEEPWEGGTKGSNRGNSQGEEREERGGAVPGGVDLDFGDEVREAREGVRLLLEGARALEKGGEGLDKGAVEIEAVVKDGGMRLLTALSNNNVQWLQGSADVSVKVPFPSNFVSFTPIFSFLGSSVSTIFSSSFSTFPLLFFSFIFHFDLLFPPFLSLFLCYV